MAAATFLLARGRRPFGVEQPAQAGHGVRVGRGKLRLGPAGPQHQDGVGVVWIELRDDLVAARPLAERAAGRFGRTCPVT